MAQVFVLDQGYFRAEQLASLASSSGSKFVVLDEALLEMCKSSEWETTMRRSLRVLAQHPTKVSVGRSLSEALRWELENKHSVAGHLLDVKGTAFLRKILEGLRDGVDTRELALMRDNIVEAQQEMEKIHFDHASNKEGMVQLVEMIGSSQQVLAAELRKGRLPREKRLEAMKGLGVELTEPFLVQGGFRPAEVRRMVRERSLSLRLTLVRLWYVFDWLARLGIETVDAAKISNEKIDLRYSTLATFFSGGLLTRDAQLERGFREVAELVRRWDAIA